MNINTSNISYDHFAKAWWLEGFGFAEERLSLTYKIKWRANMEKALNAITLDDDAASRIFWQWMRILADSIKEELDYAKNTNGLTMLQTITEELGKASAICNSWNDIHLVRADWKYARTIITIGLDIIQLPGLKTFPPQPNWVTDTLLLIVQDEEKRQKPQAA